MLESNPLLHTIRIGPDKRGELNGSTHHPREVLSPFISMAKFVRKLIAPLCAGDSDSDVPWVAICGAGVMWASLGGSVVIARIAQRKIGVRPTEVQPSEALPS